MSGSDALPPSAAGVDWSDPSIASAAQSPAPSSDDGQGFETAGEPPLDSPVGDPQIPHNWRDELANFVEETYHSGLEIAEH
jgi:hypothetical protein